MLCLPYKRFFIHLSTLCTFRHNVLIIKTIRSVHTLAFYLHFMCTLSALSWSCDLRAMHIRRNCYERTKFLSLRQKSLAPVTVFMLWQNWCVQTAVQINIDGVYTLLCADYQLFILQKCRVQRVCVRGLICYGNMLMCQYGNILMGYAIALLVGRFAWKSLFVYNLYTFFVCKP